ncbi:uroporphyrinogen-III synthase [Micromonospora marina]|uniref:uroporphyrinogen-III synthase n=1 Tax=Micromonospora marina TaxID=307120 RepID=UPI003455AD8F
MGRLSGFTVAVASSRRRHPLASLLAASDARTTSVHAVRDDVGPGATEAFLAAARGVADARVHDVVVCSASGLRAWLSSAAEAGNLDTLVAHLATARILVREPAAVAVLRDHGLPCHVRAAARSDDDLFRHLLTQPMTGRRVVAQVESDSQGEYAHLLARAGAQVVEIPLHRRLPPPDDAGLERLVALVVRRHLDAVAFTGPGAADNLLRRAAARSTLDALRDALTGPVTPVCVGDRTAEPLRDHGITPAVAATPEPTALVTLLAAELPRRAGTLTLAGRRVGLRSQAVVVDGRVVPVQPMSMAVLRVLAREPGRVFTPDEIRHAGPAAPEDHAVEVAVSRLRRALAGTALSGAGLVQTVMRRGYRIAV